MAIYEAHQTPRGVISVVGLDRQLPALIAVDRLDLTRGIVGQVHRFVRHGVAARGRRVRTISVNWPWLL